MHNQPESTTIGQVTDIFAHRFVVKTEAGSILADLGPKGAEMVSIKSGDRVELVGHKTPSELKVTEITIGGHSTTIEHPRKKEHDEKGEHKHAQMNPNPAIKAVVGLGQVVVGDIRAKPKHFEVLGKDADGAYIEHHVEFDGTIRKSKPMDADDPKWASTLMG